MIDVVDRPVTEERPPRRATSPAMKPVTPGWGTQKEAAAHCGISVRLFRDVCPVEPVPVGKPRPGKRPCLRYRYSDLDDWMESNRHYRMPRR